MAVSVSLLADVRKRRLIGKRMFDLLVGGGFLLVTLPLLLVIAVVVLISSGRPVFFVQTRVGRHGRRFRMIKVRTMHQCDDSDFRWSTAQDPLVTSIGHVLRQTHLDELPQLLNVVRGEMSLVGPRPERPALVERFAVAIPNYRGRTRMPPGMTGWAQVHGLNGDTSVRLRAQLDNDYIEAWTLGLDLAILGRTALGPARAIAQLWTRHPWGDASPLPAGEDSPVPRDPVRDRPRSMALLADTHVG